MGENSRKMENRKTRSRKNKSHWKFNEIYYSLKETPSKVFKRKTNTHSHPSSNRHLTRGSKSILERVRCSSSKSKLSIVRFEFSSFTCYMDICNGVEQYSIVKRRSRALTLPTRKQFGFFLRKSPTIDLPKHRSFFILDSDCCIPVLSIDYRRQVQVQTSLHTVKCRDQSQNCTLLKDIWAGDLSAVENNNDGKFEGLPIKDSVSLSGNNLLEVIGKNNPRDRDASHKDELQCTKATSDEFSSMSMSSSYKNTVDIFEAFKQSVDKWASETFRCTAENSGNVGRSSNNLDFNLVKVTGENDIRFTKASHEDKVENFEATSDESSAMPIRPSYKNNKDMFATLRLRREWAAKSVGCTAKTQNDHHNAVYKSKDKCLHYSLGASKASLFENNKHTSRDDGLEWHFLEKMRPHKRNNWKYESVPHNSEDEEMDAGVRLVKECRGFKSNDHLGHSELLHYYVSNTDQSKKLRPQESTNNNTWESGYVPDNSEEEDTETGVRIVEERGGFKGNVNLGYSESLNYCAPNTDQLKKVCPQECTNNKTWESGYVPDNSEEDDAETGVKSVEECRGFEDNANLGYSNVLGYFASNSCPLETSVCYVQINTPSRQSSKSLHNSDLFKRGTTKRVRICQNSLLTKKSGDKVCSTRKLSLIKSDAIFTSSTVEDQSGYSTTTSTALYFDPLMSSFMQRRSALCHSDSLFTATPKNDTELSGGGTICSVNLEKSRTSKCSMETSETTLEFQMKSNIDEGCKDFESVDTLLAEMRQSCNVQQNSSLEDVIQRSANFRSCFERLRRTSDNLRDKYNLQLNLHDIIREEAKRRCNLEHTCPPPLQNNKVLEIEIVDVKGIGGGSLLVKWQVQCKKNLIGYEIFVDQELRKRVYTANRTCTTLEGLDLGQPISIAIYALATSGRCKTPAQILCRPKYFVQ